MKSHKNSVSNKNTHINAIISETQNPIAIRFLLRFLCHCKKKKNKTKKQDFKFHQLNSIKKTIKTCQYHELHISAKHTGKRDLLTLLMHLTNSVNLGLAEDRGGGGREDMKTVKKVEGQWLYMMRLSSAPPMEGFRVWKVGMGDGAMKNGSNITRIRRKWKSCKDVQKQWVRVRNYNKLGQEPIPIYLSLHVSRTLFFSLSMCLSFLSLSLSLSLCLIPPSPFSGTASSLSLCIPSRTPSLSLSHPSVSLSLILPSPFSTTLSLSSN